VLPEVATRQARVLAIDGAHRPADLKWSERVDGTRAAFALAPSRIAAIPLLVFATFWDGILFVIYVGMFRSPKTPLFALLFPLIHVAAGVFVTWMALTALLNTARLTLGGGRFVLRQGPVPARGLSLPIEEIDGFDVVESRGSKGRVSWAARVLTKDGQARKLSLPISGAEHVGFVIGRLNEALARLRQPTGYRE
jgi:hypothetical protein